MYTPVTHAQKTLFAAASAAIAAIGLSMVASGFIPADPRAEAVRGQVVLDRVEQVRRAQLLYAGELRTAEVRAIVR